MELDLVTSVGTDDCRIAAVYSDAEPPKYSVIITRKQSELLPGMAMEIYKAYFHMMYDRDGYLQIDIRQASYRLKIQETIGNIINCNS